MMVHFVGLLLLLAGFAFLFGLDWRCAIGVALVMLGWDLFTEEGE